MVGVSRILLLLTASALMRAETVHFRQRSLDDLVAAVPAILRSQDLKTGRFGTGIWIVTDQNLMLPLAAAWSYQSDRNPNYHSQKVLDAIMAAGDALIDDQDANGQWEFRKKDGSKSGKIFMPWTYSRWVRAFGMIRDAMPRGRRERWEKALRLGYTGIAKEVEKARVQNIPAHHAMGLYFAGQVFDEPAWRKLAAEYLHKVAAAQHSDGYWSENKGPVVLYGFVYVDALGTYYAVSHDESVLPVLRKSGTFHSYFTYPDGSDVETVDDRNPYHPGVRMPNVGFSFSPEGRAYLARQIALHRGPIPADEAASLLLWGEEGEASSATQAGGNFDYRLPSGDAAIRRRGPWFLVASAMTAPVPTSRWIQDRQNFVSVYHERYGLILGGGNTKLQPAWSNFTVGDTSLLRHQPGDENPKFLPPPGLLHVPEKARLLDDAFSVDLTYGSHRGRLELDVKSPDRLELKVSGDSAMTAHVTLLPHLKEPIKVAGKQTALDGESIEWPTGGWVELAGVRVTTPAAATVRWPLLPHDPYKKDGAATPEQARIVIDFPASQTETLRVEVGH
jgi:hypothetical protein